MGPQVDELVTVGRRYPRHAFVPDCPRPDLGPLGGLCAALLHAERKGFGAVLSAPCDSLPVPDLRALLPLGGGLLNGWPLLGLWPVHLAALLLQHLEGRSSRSVLGWVRQVGLPVVAAPAGLANFNRPDEIAAYSASRHSHNR